jgi:hypothetical protein
MKKYKIYLSRTIYADAVVEAASETRAIEQALQDDEDGNVRWYQDEGVQVDEVEEIVEGHE